MARDITERRQLDQEHLVLSKLESTGILAAGIAHDFNNLLASLLLNLDFVAMCDSTTAQQANHLNQARQTVHSARALTHQLITFAEGGAPVRRITDLRGLLAQSLDVALKGSSIRGECVLASDLWSAEVDEGQIGQVLRNLVLNAREATPAEGSIRLQADNVVLATAPGPDCSPGEYLRIIVTDSGSGIPADVLPRIFDPYFSTKQRGTQKGMGLGLTICRTVIRKHGGAIAVQSTLAGGTTVVCYLPATRLSANVSRPVAPEMPKPSPRILVMDDEELFLEIMDCMLRGLGYQVELAADGDKAIALYEQAAQEGRPFAMVLLDLTVRGGMGGTKTIKLLRERDPAVRAVLMTGYSQEQAFRNHAEHGFKAALEKPFTAETLRNTLADVLQVQPGAA